MAERICARLQITRSPMNPVADDFTLICSGNGWDVRVIDWQTRANTGLLNPVQAFNNAGNEGREISAQVFPLGYDVVHLIGHSAGSNLISVVATELKSSATEQGLQPPFVQATFLDAYDPYAVDLLNNNLDFSRLGADADAVEHYLDSRMTGSNFSLSGIDKTQNIIEGAANIDVSNADTSTVVEPESGGFNFFNLALLLGNQFTSQHNWPFQFYNQSIDNPDYPLGFQLSLAAGAVRNLAALLTKSTKLCTLGVSSDACKEQSTATIPLFSALESAGGNSYLGEVIELEAIDFTGSNSSVTGLPYVFSRVESGELYWIDVTNEGIPGSVAIDSECAESLGGVSVFGSLFDLSAQAPAQGAVTHPCEQVAAGVVETSVEPAGFVFSRTDVDELRWIATNSDGISSSVWIDSECAQSRGGPTVFGDWFELTTLAPAQDSIANPCTPSVDVTVNVLATPDGYVFSRTDTNELRWIATNSDGISGSIWIDQQCGDTLGGPTASGDWFELTAQAPAQDSIASPCP